MNSQDQVVSWRRSASKGVSKYKFKIKKENERSLEYIIDDTNPDVETLTFSIPLPFQDGVEYKINVYSLSENEGVVVESEPCHVKVRQIIFYILIEHIYIEGFPRI